MGGMIVYDDLAQWKSPRVKAAVPVIATPEFVRQVRKDIERDPSLTKYYDEKALSKITIRDPSRSLFKFRDLPLLILSGTADEHMPIEDIRSFDQKAKDLYTCKDRIRLVEYPNIGHTIAVEMISEAADWFRRFI